MKLQMKDWKSVEELINLLRERGMTITDEPRAKKALERFGYYRLSGYWYPFREFRADGTVGEQFVENTHMSEIVDLYVFDKRLRLLTLDALERIELALQVDVAHTIGKLDPKAHTDITFLNSGVANKKERRNTKSNLVLWSDKYEELKRRSKHRAFVRHNIQMYGELPIWVAIEIFDFGTLSHLFKMLRRVDRDEIAAKYGLPGGNVLEQWMKSLNYVRNVSAHHERLWNNNIKDHADVPRQFGEIQRANQYRLFRYLCILQFFLRHICPSSTWKNRMREHLLSFPTPQNGVVTIEQIGIVDGWENGQLWKP